MSNQESIDSQHAKAEKLRLNAEQWRTLQMLANDAKALAGERLNTGWGRLTSNGLVATDDRGCAYLTIFGLRRLSQGR